MLISYPIDVCCAQTHKLSQMNIWPVGLQDHFSQNVSKFGFGDGNNVYEMRGFNPIFSQDPRNIDMWVGKMEKRHVKKKGNKIGSRPFLPMTRQNLDLGMGKCEKNYLKM